MQPATTSQDALTQLQQQQAQNQNPNDILSTQEQQLGVQGARDTVTGLRGAINNTTKLLKSVAPSVMGRTGNSLVTNAQAGRIIQNEQAPISQNLTDEGTQYNQANEDLLSLQQRAKDAASGIYQGQQDKNSYLQNLYTALYGRERDAASDARQATLDAQNQRAAASGPAGGTGGLADIFNSLQNSGPPTAPATPKLTIPKDIANQVKAMLGRPDQNAIKSEFNAIATSAGYGNQNDILKLKLIHDLSPNLFNGRTGALRLIGLA